MRFYTNVQLIGNQFLVRGVENGRRYEHRDEFFPTLFVKSKKDSKYRTLSGETVEEIRPGSIRDCREFYKKYDEVEGFAIYGNDRYIYPPQQTSSTSHGHRRVRRAFPFYGVCRRELPEDVPTS